MEQDLKPSPRKSPRKPQRSEETHQVIHFESPPRARLREKLEEEADKIRKRRDSLLMII